MTKPNYSPPYESDGNCLYLVTKDKHGQTRKRLCNFAPRIIREVSKDDGAIITTWVTLTGIHENGRTLPEITIPAAELSTFNWLTEHWGMDCILEVGKSVKDHVRYAIQTTAKDAERITVYTVTGWKMIHGQWQFLMPGSEEFAVELPGKLTGYHMERSGEYWDISVVGAMLDQLAAPEEVSYTLLAEIFLSPLNHFLKMVDREPKFVLWIVGKTGSRKSSIAALMLSFFGHFTATSLPMSFRDTANSIQAQAYMLKDVATVIDDFHPCGAQEQLKMTATAQSIVRNYGDRTGRGRLTASSSLMEARPPQGNAIVTAEFPPDIGESGTARCFTVELQPNDVDLRALTALQKLGADGSLQRCMYAYTKWLQEYFLDKETFPAFLNSLRRSFDNYCTEFRNSDIHTHGRVAENVAWLQLGFHYFLWFLNQHLKYGEDYIARIEEQFKEMLYRIARRQAEAIRLDKPTHLFLRKFFALIDSGQVFLKDIETLHPTEFQPGVCVGYCDSAKIYFFADQVHRMVRKLCDDQGEHFSISVRALLKSLEEEGLIEAKNGQRTRSMYLDEKNRRVVVLDKHMARVVAEGEVC